METTSCPGEIKYKDIFPIFVYTKLVENLLTTLKYSFYLFLASSEFKLISFQLKVQLIATSCAC